MIIDSHIHHYPPEVLKDPVAWAAKSGENYWASLHLPKGDGRSLQGWSDGDRLLADMDEAGIDKVVMLGWYWEHQETCEWHNRWHERWIKEFPDRFLAFASVQPLAGEKALDEVKRAIDSGQRGIGEILPAAQGFGFDHPTWLEILSWAEDNGVPVNLHVTEPAGHNYPGRIHTPLRDYQRLARQFPNLKMILAHWGGGLPFYELNPAVHKIFGNVWYDTAASPLLYDRRVFRTVADIVGVDKILFGSDYPLRLYPSQDDEHGFDRFVNEVCGSGLNDEELKQVLGGNVRNLLGF